MSKENEVKVRIEDAKELQKKLRKMGARIKVQRTFEENDLFDTARSELKKREQLLRIRKETPGARKGHGENKKEVLLTFKGPMPSQRGGNPGRHSTREEIELEASDGGALGKIFEGLNLRRWFRYEKYRTTYQLPDSEPWARDLKLELDETPIGVFMEMEGPSRAIDRAAKALGLTAKDYITANYFNVYRKHCEEQGEKPGDMVFGKRGKTRRKSK